MTAGGGTFEAERVKLSATCGDEQDAVMAAISSPLTIRNDGCK